MIDALLAQLQNEFLSGGLVLMAFGTLLALCRRLPIHIYNLLHRRFVMTIDVSDQDEAFYWLQEWFAKHPYSKKSRLLTISTGKDKFESYGNNMPKESSTSKEKPPIFFSPAPGLHLLRFEKHWLLLTRARMESKGSTSTNKYWREMFIIRTFCKDRKLVRRLIYKALSIAFPEDDKRVGIYSSNYGSWQPVAMRLPRDSDSVILPGNTMSKIIGEVKIFSNSANWYRARGIPYQLGYLLYGSPGNGKTSLALALASYFERNIYLTKVANTTDENFRNLMSNVPQNSIALIEDIDCFFDKRESKETGFIEQSLTFSGFLNAIDGITGSEGRLLILTTNHIEKLDSALLRPGRVDHKVELLNANKDQARQLFLRFFNNEEQSKEFASAIKDYKFSMADLQGILINNRNDAEAAVKAVATKGIKLQKVS